MSKFHSRAAFFKGTTLTERGDYDARAAINTGTRTPSTPILLGGTDGNRWQQPGADDNRSQTAQAYAGFMNMRKSTLFTELECGRAEENRANRGQAKLRLKGEVF